MHPKRISICGRLRAMTMKRFRYGLFLISIFLSAPSWAQDCRIRFSIGYSDGKKIQMGLTHDQTRFWQRDSEKVYSGLCLDWTKPSYAIIWTESLSGEGAVESVVQELNRITTVAPSKPNKSVGQLDAAERNTLGGMDPVTVGRLSRDPSSTIVVSNQMVHEAAYYYILDLSKQPPAVVRKGIGERYRPIQPTKSTAQSRGNTAVETGQESNPSDFATTIADPVAAVKNALDWLKKKP